MKNTKDNLQDLKIKILDENKRTKSKKWKKKIERYKKKIAKYKRK